MSRLALGYRFFTLSDSNSRRVFSSVDEPDELCAGLNTSSNSYARIVDWRPCRETFEERDGRKSWQGATGSAALF